MIRLFKKLALLPLFFAATLFVSAEDAAKTVKHTYAAPPLFEHEVVTVVQLLENKHYNRDGVRPADFGQLVKDYMAEFDSQRLFFLESDRVAFEKRYPSTWLYNNITTLGKIDPAFTIYTAFQERAAKRVNWILEKLKGELDLTTKETYTIDRSKSPWPSTDEEADTLWVGRLKFELVQEIVGKKTPEKARQDLSKRYERMLKNLSETESNELCEIFLSTLTRLYDPHSTYFSADTLADFAIQMRLQLVGIGAVLGVEDDYCVVRELVAGGPADLSKQIHPNDKILAVAQDNGEQVDIVGMKLRKIVDMVRGSKNTKVHLVIQPATDASQRKEIVIVRDIVNLNSARARAAIYDIPSSDGKSTSPIGVITLPAFYGPDASSEGPDIHSASRDVEALIGQLNAAGVKGLVLDLRQNGGGLLREAIDLVGLFIKTGPVVQVKDYYGDVEVDTDDNPGVAYSGPLAVLVSRFSASASEIAAGALQNYGRAVIVGDSSTHGKGSVQEIKPSDSPFARISRKSGAVKLTIQKFYLPNGHSTQLNGVVPDIVLPSIDDFLPVGEKDLPHALVWDEIPPSRFEGSPLDADLAKALRTASNQRLQTLPEFTYIKKNIDWFKTKQDIKAVSLNLEDRLKEKEQDTTFRKSMDAEREVLAKGNYAMREFNLGPKAQPNIKAKPTETDGTGDEDTDDETKKIDVHLREALRVLNDSFDYSKAAGAQANAGALTLESMKKS